jgi:hypothetical protein
MRLSQHLPANQNEFHPRLRTGVVTPAVHNIPKRALHQAALIEDGFIKSLNHQPVQLFESSAFTSEEFNQYFSHDMRNLVKKTAVQVREKLDHIDYSLSVYQGLNTKNETEGVVPEKIKVLNHEKSALLHALSALKNKELKLSLSFNSEGLRKALLLLPPQAPQKQPVPKLFLSELEPHSLSTPDVKKPSPVLVIPKTIQDTTLNYWMNQPLRQG